MTVKEFVEVLVHSVKNENTYEIHFNSGNLEENKSKTTGVEFSDMYFGSCSKLENSSYLVFGNGDMKPIGKTDKGIDIVPMATNSVLYIDVTKIENIEEVENVDDWFEIPAFRIINLVMANSDVVSIGFMKG